MIFLVFDNMGSNVSENFETLHLLQIAGNQKLFWIFPLMHFPHQTTLAILEILSFRFLTIFFWKISNQVHPKTSIISKTSDRRAKLSEIWNSREVLQHISGTYLALYISRHFWVICRTCDFFAKTQFYKCWFFYTYDSVIPKLFYVFPKTAHSYFLAFNYQDYLWR